MFVLMYKNHFRGNLIIKLLFSSRKYLFSLNSKTLIELPLTFSAKYHNFPFYMELIFISKIELLFYYAAKNVSFILNY